MNPYDDHRDSTPRPWSAQPDWDEDGSHGNDEPSYDDRSHDADYDPPEPADRPAPTRSAPVGEGGRGGTGLGPPTTATVAAPATATAGPAFVVCRQRRAG